MTAVINLRERKKVQARARIIAAAIKLFSRDGFDAVTVEHIAAAADVGKGTIYNYFAAKEDIVVAFMAESEEKMQAKVGQLAASPEPLAAMLAGFILFQFRLKQAHHRFVRVFLAQMFARTEEFLPYLTAMQKAIDPPLMKMFRELQNSGRMRQDIPLEQLILAFKTIHMGLSALWAIEGPPFKVTERTVRLEMKLFAEGLEVKKQ